VHFKKQIKFVDIFNIDSSAELSSFLPDPGCRRPKPFKGNDSTLGGGVSIYVLSETRSKFLYTWA
jgi:hypothetical protein